MLTNYSPRLEVAVECSVALQLAPALLLLPGKRRTRLQVTEAEEVSSEVGIGDSGGRHVSCNTVTCNTVT